MTDDRAPALDAIRADDDLLDRLARREEVPGAGIESLLAAWTATIDEGAAELSGPAVPWGRARAAAGLGAGATALASASSGVSTATATAAGGATHAAAGGATRADAGDHPEIVPLAAPRTVRLRGSRAAAIAAGLVISMSGGGVAAALTGQDVPIMSSFIAKARGAAPTPDAAAAAWE